MFGNRLKELRQRNLYSMDKLAELYNKKFDGKLNKSTISRYENGLQEPMFTTVKNFAELFGVSSDYLTEASDDYEKSNTEPRITTDYTTFPIIGDIAAGFDHIATEDWTGDTIDVPNSHLKGRKSSDFFVLCVKGDSMFPTYQENDKVLILRQSTVNYSGQVGAVIYDDDCATLKKVEFKQGEDWIKLVPINPTYPTVFIENERLEHCRVLGIPQLLIREITDR